MQGFIPKGLQTNKKMGDGENTHHAFHGPKSVRADSDVKDARSSTTFAVRHERQFNKW